MNTMQNLTVVSKELVWCDYRLLVEFTDGSVRTYVCDREPDKYDLNRMRYVTADYITAHIGDLNSMSRLNANIALHESKVARLGWDYAKRGY